MVNELEANVVSQQEWAEKNNEFTQRADEKDKQLQQVAKEAMKQTKF